MKMEFKTLRKIVARSGMRKSVKKPAVPIPKASFDYIDQAKSDHFTVGFGKAELPPPRDITQKKYWVAGYRINNPATGILDVQMAHAVWIDDNSGRGGIVLVSVDCVGLFAYDIEKILAKLDTFKRETGCRSINIMSTHTHAGIDTMGYWGPLPRTGIDKEFMQVVYNGVAEAVQKAYHDRRDGDLFAGSNAVPDGFQRDSIDPQVYSKDVTRLRFVPRDGTREIHIINFASHAESLTGQNSLISADFPRYMKDYILEQTGAEAFMINGAVGGLICLHPLDDDHIESTKKAGVIVAKTALAITNERKLEPKINFIRQDFYVDIDNHAMWAMAFIHVMTVNKHYTGNGQYGISLKTSASYFEIGEVKIAMIPGEIFPELVYGGYLPEDARSNFMEAPAPLTEIIGDENVLVFGLCNDEIGYICTPNNFVLNPDAPYINDAKDDWGRKHYCETNSLGPCTAGKIADVFKEMMDTVHTAKNKIKQK